VNLGIGDRAELHELPRAAADLAAPHLAQLKFDSTERPTRRSNRPQLTFVAH
jgi:hypothetical protein